ncbi:hypothetical protein HMPREF3156_01582 [Neisseria sp. HMSC06F02]|nr:hypothetical protein HMPREF3156_01582 [Neisseria sp. HMSC06F02]
MFYNHFIKNHFQDIATHLHIFPILKFIQTFKMGEKNYNYSLNSRPYNKNYDIS